MKAEAFSSDRAASSEAATGEVPFTKTTFVVQRKDVFDMWGTECMSYSTFDMAMKSIPEWRKDSKRRLRIVRETTQIVWVDAHEQGEGNV